MELSNIELLGERVLLQLDEHPDHSITPGGVIQPKWVNVESDGGKPKVKPSNQKHVSSATVLLISSQAAEKISLVPGDKVYVNQAAVSQSYHFLISRNNLVDEFDGVIAVPPQLIEAKIIPNV